jgi:hypothetical protein
VGKRIALAGLLAGVGMYIWSSVAHIALPLGEAGISEISNEEPVLGALQTAIGGQSGFYIFPGMDLQHDMKQYEAKLASSPSGLLIYHPPGRKALTLWQLITEFLTELVEVLLAVYLLAQTRLTTFGARLAFFTVIGIISGIATNIPYWNWYGFPGTYTVAAVSIQVIGFIVAGAIAAMMMRERAPNRAAVAA